MTIGGIGGNQNIAHWHLPASPGTGAARSATDSIANTGSVTAGNMASFFQSFSADLQATLRQGATGQTAANQPLSGVHHRHYHHGEGGSGGPQGAANQLTAEIGQSLGGISQSASSFGPDAIRAVQAYGATGSATAKPSIPV
jgi:hypothetical protein